MPITLKDNNTTHKINLSFVSLIKEFEGFLHLHRVSVIYSTTTFTSEFWAELCYMSKYLLAAPRAVSSPFSCELQCVFHKPVPRNLKLRHNSREWQKSWAEFPQWLGFHDQPGGCLPQYLACCCQSAWDCIQCSKTHFQTPCWELHCF